MKILCLYNNPCAEELFDWIRNEGNEVVIISTSLDVDWCKKQNFELTISYTYRYILTEDIIKALNNNVVNIHNSFLPYNRGADPNMWSIIDSTPSGVTIHYIDKGIDTGNIIAQSIVSLEKNDTLATSYYRLDVEAKELFKRVFPFYDYWKEMKKEAVGKGTYHSVADGIELKRMIPDYDISINEFKKIFEERYKKV